MYENMKEVTSSNIESVGYAENVKILYVKFLNGNLYSYKGVPLNKYNELVNASSVGKYLNQNIKGTYSYVQVK